MDFRIFTIFTFSFIDSTLYILCALNPLLSTFFLSFSLSFVSLTFHFFSWSYTISVSSVCSILKSFIIITNRHRVWNLSDTSYPLPFVVTNTVDPQKLRLIHIKSISSFSSRFNTLFIPPSAPFVHISWETLLSSFFLSPFYSWSGRGKEGGVRLS